MAAALKSVPCENCRAPISIRAQGISITFACQSCGSIIDLTQDGYKLLNKAKTNFLTLLQIPLGSRGMLCDIEWEVIGFMRREDVKWFFSWDEYLLFNPYHGFRFLIHSQPDSHFALTTLLTKSPEKLSGLDAVRVDEMEFSLFHKGISAVRAVAGEFYWRIRLNERTEFADYIRPPFGVSRERPEIARNNAETTFSLAMYIPVDVVRAAFNRPNLPKPYGVYPIQPNRFTEAKGAMWVTATLALIVLIAAQIILERKCTSQRIFDAQRSFSRSEAGLEQLLAEIELPLQSQNVEILSNSPVNNSWVEVEYELQSEDGGEAGWAGQAIEYYHGYSDGEQWSEGSTSMTSVIGPLSGRRYKVFATVDADSFSRDMVSSIGTRIRVNVPVRGNFLLAFLIILVWPVVVAIRSSMVERKRWAESSYSPYLEGGHYRE